MVLVERDRFLDLEEPLVVEVGAGRRRRRYDDRPVRQCRRRHDAAAAARGCYRRHRLGRASVDEILRSDGSHRARRFRSIPRTADRDATERRQADGAVLGIRPTAETGRPTARNGSVRTVNIAGDS